MSTDPEAYPAKTTLTSTCWVPYGTEAPLNRSQTPNRSSVSEGRHSPLSPEVLSAAEGFLKSFLLLLQIGARLGAEAALDGRLAQKVNDTRPMSPRGVARLAKVADKDAYDALKNGTLKGLRSAKGRWTITREDAAAWAKTIKRC